MIQEINSLISNIKVKLTYAEVEAQEGSRNLLIGLTIYKNQFSSCAYCIKNAQNMFNTLKLVIQVKTKEIADLVKKLDLGFDSAYKNANTYSKNTEQEVSRLKIFIDQLYNII